MRKISLIAILFIVICIMSGKYPFYTVKLNKPVNPQDSPWYVRIMNETENNKYIDSLTAAGATILVRGADSTYDTIIDHFRYTFIKDK